LSRSRAAPAAHVTRARLVLLVADGRSSPEAARAAGRKSGDAVAHLVARFNGEGTAAVAPRHGGGRARVCGEPARDRTLREAQRLPTPEQGGTAPRSLSTPQRALRQAADGLPRVSTYTPWPVLREAGYRPQESRTGCPTGPVVRRRQAGRALVTGPDARPKKS
jgi:transposase